MAIVDREQWRREQERRIQSRLPKPQSKFQLNGENLVQSIEELIQQQRARRAKLTSDYSSDIPRGLKDPRV